MGDLTTLDAQSLSEAREALAIATEHLGLEIGIVSEIIGDVYTVVTHVAPPKAPLHDGQRFGLGETYCAITMDADDLVTIDEMKSSEHSGHPCYQAFGLESYIGVPLRCDGSRFGTLNFSAAKPRASKYGKAERGLVRLVAAQMESILERMRLKRDAELADALFRALFDQSVDAIVLHRHGEILQANASALALFGAKSYEELVARPVFDYIPHEADRETAATRIERLARGEVPGPPFELVVRRIDGEIRTVETIGVPIERPDGLAALSLVRDLTERRRQREQLMQAERLASVGSLAAGVAHELNNPLAYVIANLEVVEEDLDEVVPSARLRDMQDAVREAREGAERARRIVRDLRTFSRVDDERHVPIDVHRLLDVSVSMAMNEIRHRAHLVRAYGDVPLVEGDESRLTQVFVNLLVNAAHAIPEGAIDGQEVRIVTDTDPRGWCRVRVIDTGSGIADEQRSRIFDPFFTTKPVGKGTGLGLSLSHSILESHGGTIDADNRPEGGAVFTVSLPAAAVPSEPEPSVGEAEGRVLVIDDDAMIGRALQRVLGRVHEVVVCSNGADALARLEDEEFDVILCDLMMPTMPGWVVFEKIRERDAQLAARVIFLTGGALGPTGEAFLESVPNLCLGKPFDVRQLRSVIDAEIQRRR